MTKKRMSNYRQSKNWIKVKKLINLKNFQRERKLRGFNASIRVIRLLLFYKPLTILVFSFTF